MKKGEPDGYIINGLFYKDINAVGNKVYRKEFVPIPVYFKPQSSAPLDKEQPKDEDVEFEQLTYSRKFLTYYQDFYKNGNPYKHLPINSDEECISEFIEDNPFPRAKIEQSLNIEEAEAIDFADWIIDSGWYKVHYLSKEYKWCDAHVSEYGGKDDDYFTTKELYQQFKQWQANK